MPGELTQAEFYHYYTASQRRVELWVQETNKTLSIQGQETQLPEKDILPFLPSPQLTQTQLPLPIQLLPTTPSNLKEQESPDQDVAGKPPRLSGRSKDHDITRTPSKHRAHDPSRSRSRPSSGSKLKIARGHDKPTTKASRTSTRPRSAGRHSSEDTSSGLAAYIPYGVLPLLFAVTGASTLSIVAGVILLSGFVYVEQLHENPVSWCTCLTLSFRFLRLMLFRCKNRNRKIKLHRAPASYYDHYDSFIGRVLILSAFPHRRKHHYIPSTIYQ
jgi:hypothetical protein